jgi:hypothetical protein
VNRHPSLVAVVGLAALACGPVASTEPAAVLSWLECEECATGQLDSVVAIGDPVVPLLAGYLLNGPPPQRVDSLLAHLGASHAVVAGYHRSLDTAAVGTVSDSARYVRRYVTNYIATYQSRSARALGLIGGPEAKAALDSASRLPVRSDVRYQIQYALDSLWTP